MAHRIVWTERASHDLEDIVLYLKARNPDAAARIGRGFFERVSALAEFPESGAVVREIGDSRYRKVLFRSWKIVYEPRMDDNIIVILRLWHAARGELEL